MQMNVESWAPIKGGVIENQITITNLAQGEKSTLADSWAAPMFGK